LRKPLDIKKEKKKGASWTIASERDTLWHFVFAANKLYSTNVFGWLVLDFG
jgi:hypothetical protein